MSFIVEAVEKVPKQILGWDVEKSVLTECATINDLMLRMGQETPKNTILTSQKDFSYRLVRLVPWRKELGSKLNYTLYNRQIKLVDSDLIIEFQKKKRGPNTTADG